MVAAPRIGHKKRRREGIAEVIGGAAMAAERRRAGYLKVIRGFPRVRWAAGVISNR